MHEQELKILRQLSAYSLPDNPSQHGWTPQQIKAKFYEGLEYLFNLFYKITDTTNEKAEELGETMQTFQVQLTNILDGTVSVGKANKDGEGQEISKTYIKLVDLLNGSVAALKYISEDGNARNIKDLEREIETFIETHSQFMANTFDGFVALRTKKAETAVADQEGNPIHNTYVKKSNVVDDLYQTSTEKPLSANQGRILKQLIDSINNILKSDDISLDTIREIVEYIKTNKNLIENVTNAKINYSDIIDNLESQLSNKPLSANQGVILKRQIEEQINDLKALRDLYTVLNEKLEGKKNTYIVDATHTLETVKSIIDNGVQVYNNLGINITEDILKGRYDEVDIVNNVLNTNDDIIKLNPPPTIGHYMFVLKPNDNSESLPLDYSDIYVLDRAAGIFKRGDTILLVNKEIPDRWYGGYPAGQITFFALETRKIDLNNYATIDYVDDELQNVREVAEGKNKSLVITATLERDPPTRENYYPYDYYRVDGSGIETFDDLVAYMFSKTLGGYNEGDLRCLNDELLNGNDITEIDVPEYGYIIHHSRVIPAWYIYENFKVGDVILITETNIPDWWISDKGNGVVCFSKLETTKVDLQNYVEKTTEINKVYGTSSVGAQYTYSVTDSAVPNTIVKRDTTGATKVKGIKVDGKIDFGVKTEGRTNTSYLETDSYDGITFNVNGVKPLTIYDNGIYISTSTLPNANGSFDLGKPQNKWKDLYLSGYISNGSQSFSVNDLVDLKNALGIWVPTASPVSTTITSARGKSWECHYQILKNTLTNKSKVEYTLYSLTEETATAELIQFNLIATVTIGASYVTDTIGYANLPKPIDGDTYWTFDSFTFDEASDVGNQCTPLPFRGSGGFETRILVIDETPPASITFKKVIAKVSLYEK